MKLINVRVNGINILDKEFELSLFAKTNVSEQDKRYLKELTPKLYINNVVAITGLNASGKTTTLDIISTAFDILSCQHIDFWRTIKLLQYNKEVTFNLIFFTKNKHLCKLKTTLKLSKDENEKNKVKIIDEKLWIRNTTIKSKQDIFTFNSANSTIEERNMANEYISDDVSIIIKYNKKYKDGINGTNTSPATDINIANMMNLKEVTGTTMNAITNFIDPTIESFSKIQTKNGFRYNIEFKNGSKYTTNDHLAIQDLLSSGTVRGIPLLTEAIKAIKLGRYLIIDEIETHFNYEIVSAIVRMFSDSKINKNGAVLIFSTHYPELLDNIKRTDSIFFCENSNSKIKITSFSDKLKRKDIKKSEAYKSSYLGNTAPSYEAYKNLIKVID